jgi:hypothetical protein
MSVTRRIASLFAAYAVALQLLLLPLGVAAGALTAEAHCASDGTAQHQGNAYPCCGSGCGTLCQHHGVATPSAAVSLDVLRTSLIVRIDLASQRAAGPAPDRLVRARGPPQSERT